MKLNLDNYIQDKVITVYDLFIYFRGTISKIFWDLGKNLGKNIIPNILKVRGAFTGLFLEVQSCRGLRHLIYSETIAHSGKLKAQRPPGQVSEIKQKEEFSFENTIKAY